MSLSASLEILKKEQNLLSKYAFISSPSECTYIASTPISSPLFFTDPVLSERLLVCDKMWGLTEKREKILVIEMYVVCFSQRVKKTL